MNRKITFAAIIMAAMLPALGYAQQCGEQDPKCAPILKASGEKIAEINAAREREGINHSINYTCQRTACAAQIGVDAVDACLAVTSPSCKAQTEAMKEALMPTLRTAIECARKTAADDDANWEPDKAKCRAFGQAGTDAPTKDAPTLADSSDDGAEPNDPATLADSSDDGADELTPREAAMQRELARLKQDIARTEAERDSFRDHARNLYSQNQSLQSQNQSLLSQNQSLQAQSQPPKREQRGMGFGRALNNVLGFQRGLEGAISGDMSAVESATLMAPALIGEDAETDTSMDDSVLGTLFQLQDAQKKAERGAVGESDLMAPLMKHADGKRKSKEQRQREAAKRECQGQNCNCTNDGRRWGACVVN